MNNQTQEQPTSKKLYKPISEAAELLKVSASAIRFWEKEFKQLKPHTVSGRRYYSQDNIQILETIKDLLYNKGYTIDGAKKYLTELKRSSAASDDTIKQSSTSSELREKIEQALKKLCAVRDELKNLSE